MNKNNNNNNNNNESHKHNNNTNSNNNSNNYAHAFCIDGIKARSKYCQVYLCILQLCVFVCIYCICVRIHILVYLIISTHKNFELRAKNNFEVYTLTHTVWK